MQFSRPSFSRSPRRPLQAVPHRRRQGLAGTCGGRSLKCPAAPCAGSIGGRARRCFGFGRSVGCATASPARSAAPPEVIALDAPAAVACEEGSLGGGLHPSAITSNPRFWARTMMERVRAMLPASSGSPFTKEWSICRGQNEMFVSTGCSVIFHSEEVFRPVFYAAWDSSEDLLFRGTLVACQDR